LKSLSRSALVLQLESVLALARPRGSWPNSQSDQEADPPRNSGPQSPDPGVNFLNVARESGLNLKTIFGGEQKNKYLLETTGCGVAFYDYDNDGWLDIFLVNGSRLEGFPPGTEPTSHLFQNNRDGTFTDVTAKADVLRKKCSLPQQRRRHFHRCNPKGRRGGQRHTMEHRLRLRRL
jgi:hypothetical protein